MSVLIIRLALIHTPAIRRGNIALVEQHPLSYIAGSMEPDTMIKTLQQMSLERNTVGNGSIEHQCLVRKETENTLVSSGTDLILMR